MNIKNYGLAVLAAGALALGPHIPAVAQEFRGPGMEDGAGRHHASLDLSEDQKTKMKALKRTQRKALRPLFNKQRDLLDALKDQVEDKAPDADLEKSLAAVQANRAAIKDQMEKFRGQTDAILTPTQRAKKLLGHGRGRGGWGGHAGHDGDAGRDEDRDR